MLDDLADLLVMWIEFIDAMVTHVGEIKDDLEDRLRFIITGTHRFTYWS